MKQVTKWATIQWSTKDKLRNNIDVSADITFYTSEAQKHLHFICFYQWSVTQN